MATAWSKDAVLKVDDSGGTLRTLTTYALAVDGLPGAFDELDKTTFGETGHRVEAGLANGEFTVEILWDNTVTTGPDVVLSGARGKVGTFEYGPAGGTPSATTPVYKGEALCRNFAITGRVGELTRGRAEFKVDGVVTRAVA